MGGRTFRCAAPPGRRIQHAAAGRRERTCHVLRTRAFALLKAEWRVCLRVVVCPPVSVPALVIYLVRRFNNPLSPLLLTSFLALWFVFAPNYHNCNNSCCSCSCSGVGTARRSRDPLPKPQPQSRSTRTLTACSVRRQRRGGGGTATRDGDRKMEMEMETEMEMEMEIGKQADPHFTHSLHSLLHSFTPSLLHSLTHSLTHLASRLHAPRISCQPLWTVRPLQTLRCVDRLACAVTRP